MTPTDIDNLQAGRELDALIAERIFGDFPVHLGDAPYVQTPSPHNDMHYAPVESYSTDIAAAWLVVEKFNDYSTQLDSHGNGYTFHIYKDATSYNGDAKTAPLAICRAALKAVSAQENTK